MRSTTGSHEGAIVAGCEGADQRGAAPGPGVTSWDGARAVPCRGLSPLSAVAQDLVLGVREAVRRAIWRRRHRVGRLCGLGLEDVEQEALLAVCRAVRTWRPERGPFAAYAQTAAMVHLDYLCRRQRWAKRRGITERLGGPVADALVSPGLPVGPAAVERALGQLSVRVALVVRLHLAGQSREEIARSLGVQVTSVYGSFTQARDRLRAVGAS